MENHVSRVAPSNALPDDNRGDDLARFCLELDSAESQRALMWVNAICLTCLIVGWMGIQAQPLAIRRKSPPPEEAVATLIEPLITPVQTVVPEMGDAQGDRTTEEGFTGVAVTVDSLEVAFSVPTVGNILVPLALAAPPPAQPMAGAVSLDMPRLEPIEMTAPNGQRPPPSYPRASLLEREQGAVELLIETEEGGAIRGVTVQRSSGYPRLDHAAREHVRKTWQFPSSQTNRLYSCSIVFQMK